VAVARVRVIRMLHWIRNILQSASGADDWQRLWEARVAALESLLGKCDGTVYHSPPPLHLDGHADVLRFRDFVRGVTYATCDLIGNPRQVPNERGAYELVMCTRDESNWAPAVLSRLAKYTHDAAVHTGDTMDIGRTAPRNSSIAALLFTLPDINPTSFEVLGKRASLVLCIGITATEFALCKTNNSAMVVRMLRDQGIFPYTDLRRASVTTAA
jgi:hypothetical protein